LMLRAGSAHTLRMELRRFGFLAIVAIAGLPWIALAEDPAPKPMPAAPVKEVAPNKTIALLGQPVIGPLGQEVGRVVDVLVDGKGDPQAAVIDFGGFMGVGIRKIAVQWNTLHFNPGDPKYPVVLDLLPEQLKAAPAYKGETKPAPVVAPPWEAPAKPEQEQPKAGSGAAKAQATSTEAGQ